MANIALPFQRHIAQPRPSIRPKGSAVAQAPAASSLLTSLVMDCDLGEASGQRYDSIGAMHLLGMGTTYPPVIAQAAGPVGNAASLAVAQSQYLMHWDCAALRLGDIDFTVSAWIYLNALGANQFVMCRFGTNGANADYELFVTNTNLAKFMIYKADNTNKSVTANTFGTLSQSTWYHLLAWHDKTNDLIGIEVNGIADTAATAGLLINANCTAPLNISGYNNGAGFFLDGRCKGVRRWNRLLTPAEKTQLNLGTAVSFYPYVANAWTIAITSPEDYRTFQRNGSNQANIAITGTYTGSPSAIEASWNGGAYTTIDAAPTGGSFSGTLSNQAAGQGTLTVRFKNDTTISHSHVYVGIGDIFVIAGQSNASGRATNNQVYSHATLKATLLQNSDTWGDLIDPTDHPFGETVHTASDIVGVPKGSIWPPLATSVMANNSLPVAFIPCALGGSSITAWQPGANHQDRTTLYGNMVYRTNLAGGCRAVLWWQGETDAAADMSTATYQTNLQAIADALNTDLPGVTFLPAKLQAGQLYDGTQQGRIVTAVDNVWDTGNIGTGPDLSGLTTDAADHFTLDASNATVATAWWNAIKTQFGW